MEKSTAGHTGKGSAGGAAQGSAFSGASSETPVAAIKAAFQGLFGQGGRLHVIRAPGRVNLIGEHTDYNDGFVFPMAIEPEVMIVCRARDDGKIRLATTAFPGEICEFSVQGKIARADAARGEPGWSNYCRGVAAEMEKAGLPITGMDALISNTLPVGGGLSSSAAIEVGTGLALLTLQGEIIDRMRLALICQKAEHEYAHVPSGIMDQMIVASATAGHATLFDCRSYTKRYVPLDPKELRVVIANSMIRHELSSGEYRKRREQCEAGVKYFQHAEGKPADRSQVKALRDVTEVMLEAAQGKMDEVIFRRCRHVITENRRTTEAAALLEKQDYDRAGELMVQSHDSLRDDYEVSCPELDFLVVEAMKVKGVYGARMTGGGFGGCIVALAQPRSVETLTEHLKKTYRQQFQLEAAIYVTTATAGGSVVE